ncbi:MAG: MoaD/ThiS family protein [Desulfobacterales bacterium]|nr:MoaD/ThiS family protein [Desulfobacterales bacterium]
MIRVTVKLSGPLRKQCKSTPSSKGEEAELKTGYTVADLMAQYDIAPRKAHMIMVNRRKADLTTTLRDGDEVRILPLAAGG